MITASEKGMSRVNMDTEVGSPRQVDAKSIVADISGENIGSATGEHHIGHPRRRLATVVAGIGVAAALLGIPKTPGVAAGPAPTEGPQGTTSPALMVENPASLEVLQKQQEIEQKYGIDLISKQDPLAQTLEKTAPVKIDDWTIEELSVMDSTLSSIAPTLYKPINGIKLKIFIGDIGDQCSGCAGVEYGKSRIAGFQKQVVSESYAGGFPKLATHEFTHGEDNVTDNSLWPKVNEILGDKTFLKLKEFTGNQGKPGDSNELTPIAGSVLGFKFKEIDPVLAQKLEDQKMAVNTLSSFTSAESFPEGIAGVSEVYILGEERFLLAFGPVLDGNGYDNNGNTNNPALEELIQKYPKAEALYILYENSVFGGREYTPDSALIPKN